MELRIPGLGVQGNKGSTVQRQWVTVHDPEALGLRLLAPEPKRRSAAPRDPKTVGPTVFPGSTGSLYQVEYRVQAVESITAFEIRFVLFDIWGDKLVTLVGTEVTDLRAGETREFKAAWNVFPRTDGEVFYGSVAWIERVRLANGQVIEADKDFVLEQTEVFSIGLNEEDLIPSDIG